MHSGLTLEKRIAAELASYDGMMGIYLDDLKGNVVAIHEDEPFETASTIKTYILAALYEQVEEGTLSLEDSLIYKKEHFVEGSGVFRELSYGATLTVRDVARLMMVISDNSATYMMIDYIGLDQINACIQRLGCFDTILHNPIDFERYERLGTSTPKDYASLFTRLARRELISHRAS